MSEVTPQTGIITAVVAGTSASQWGGHFEACYLNTFYARGMYLAAFFGNPCVVGKSMLFRRSTADRFGGIKNLSRYLAEDYMAGKGMEQLGLKVQIMSAPITQHIGAYTFRDFWARHLRWGRIRKSQAPLAFIAEPLSMSVVSGLLGSFAGWWLFGFSPAAWFTSHGALWAGRECLALPQWVAIAKGRSVNWRGQKLILEQGGLLRRT